MATTARGRRSPTSTKRTVKFGIVVFPGSNCDQDCRHALGRVLGQRVTYLWHQAHDLEDCDAVILPGGFSYGDYLRTGAVARFSPILGEVLRFAKRGGLVVGICNGFQILLEAGLLPGAMLRNAGLRFLCQDVDLRVETADAPCTRGYRQGQVIRMPIAHGEGNYFADDDALARLESEGRVLLRYCTPQGELTEDANPNGSMHAIAGLCNEQRNVMALMPHPERCAEEILGNDDGRAFFTGLVEAACRR